MGDIRDGDGGRGGVAGSGCDLVLRGGTVYDGRGGAPFTADVGIVGDRVVAIGPGLTGREVLDVEGLAVAPGFINMLSWANESLIADPRGQSDVRQGVTCEVLGEGESMGPLTEAMAADLVAEQDGIHYPVTWRSLAGYLDHLAARGVAVNVASFVGATTVRIHELGNEDRASTPSELERMCALVDEAMRQGAVGVCASLIYAPASYAATDELIALARVAARHGGLYAAHLRSETGRLLEAVDEHLRIARESGARAEIYHLKAAGRANWATLEEVIGRIEQARDDGLEVTADMYPYTAASTGLDAAMPPWVQEGGPEAWRARLADPAVAERVEREMRDPDAGWENLLLAAGADHVRFTQFRSDALAHLTGRTLADVARDRRISPERAAIELVREDGSRVGAAYELMSEQNVMRELGLPWMSFCSDSPAFAPEGVFLRWKPHPRGYGAFARVLGHYVRERSALTLPEAIRRLAALPAQNLRLRDRGVLRAGAYADVAVFDPDTIADHATFDDPHRYATGMRHVLVNGVPVLRDGEHTGALPGRVLHGPGAAHHSTP